MPSASALNAGTPFPQPPARPGESCPPSGKLCPMAETKTCSAADPHVFTAFHLQRSKNRVHSFAVAAWLTPLHISRPPPAQPPLQHTPNNRALHVGRNGMIRRGPRTSRDRARDEHTQKGTTEHPTGLTRRRLAPKHGAPEGFCQVQASQHGHNGTPRAGFVSDNRTWGRCGLAMPGPRRGCRATRCAAHTAPAEAIVGDRLPAFKYARAPRTSFGASPAEIP